MVFSESPLNPQQIRKLLKTQKTDISEPTGFWKRAAVLALFVPGEGGLNMIFTRRTDLVMDHKGQVSFPGGAVEEGDNSLEETALREAQEEISLEPRAVELLGRSSDLFTPTGWWITPVVGWYPCRDGFIANPAEVSRIFTIPIDWLASPSSWEKRTYKTQTIIRKNVIFYEQYDGEILWGVTAEIVHTLLKLLLKLK